MAFKKTLRNILFGTILAAQAAGCGARTAQTNFSDAGVTPDAQIAQVDTYKPKADSTSSDAGVPQTDAIRSDNSLDAQIQPKSDSMVPPTTDASQLDAKNPGMDARVNANCTPGMQFKNEYSELYGLRGLTVKSDGTVTKGSHQVHNRESSSFFIKPGDYVLLSTRDSTGSKVTDILRYDSIDPVGKEIKFTDEPLNGFHAVKSPLFFSYARNGSSLQGTIYRTGLRTAKFEVSDETPNAKLRIDLNADGTFNDAVVKIHTSSGAKNLRDLLYCRAQNDPQVKSCDPKIRPKGWFLYQAAVEEGEKKNLILGQQFGNHVLEVRDVDDNTGKAQFVLNGHKTKYLGPCEQEKLPDGNYVFVRSTFRFPKGSHFKKDIVELFLGK